MNYILTIVKHDNIIDFFAARRAYSIIDEESAFATDESGNFIYPDILLGRKIGNEFEVEEDAITFFKENTIDVSRQGDYQVGGVICNIFKEKLSNLVDSTFLMNNRSLFSNVIVFLNLLAVPEKVLKLIAERGDKVFASAITKIIPYNIDGKKEKAILLLPPAIINEVSEPENKYNCRIDLWQTLTSHVSDNSELIYLKDFIDKTEFNSRQIIEFMECIAKICGKLNSSVKQVLSYIVKQLWVSKDVKICSDDILTITTRLVDTINMMLKNKMMPEMPQRLNYSHMFLQRNSKLLEDSKKYDAGIKAVSEKYCHLTYQTSEYIVTMPHSTEEIIEEGSKLHHCVASYCKNIVEEHSLVFFLRKTSEPNIPFVTVEFDPFTISVVQIKQDMDEDVYDERVILFVSKWMQELKKGEEKKYG